jgi:hypothetical protein
VASTVAPYMMPRAHCRSEAIIEALLGPGDWMAIFLANGKQETTMHKLIGPHAKTMVHIQNSGILTARPGEQVQVLHRQDTRSLRQ